MAFIAYTKALDNRVTFLQTEAEKEDSQTVCPVSKIISNTGMSATAATLISELRKDCKTQAESMSQLTKMMTMFLAKAPTGEPMGAVKNINAEDRGGGTKRKLIPLQHCAKYAAKW